MAAWFEPLLALLGEQPPDTTTVTLTLGDLEALTRGLVPADVVTERYWQGYASTVRGQLATIGWSMVRLNRRSRTLTFARIGGPA